MMQKTRTPEDTSDTHGQRVTKMFGRIAPWYDFLNHALSLGQDIIWRNRLVNHLRPVQNGTVLDLAAGTLDVSTEILRQYPTTRVLALDFTYPMLLEGVKKKIRGKREESIYPIQADAKCIPLANDSVAGASIAFGIRNILPREQCYAEVLRVLTPGARFCILEFGTGSRRVWKGVYNFYLNTVLPSIGRMISGDSSAYRYLADTIKAFPDEQALSQELLTAGFSRVFHVPMLSGIVYAHIAEKSQDCAQKKSSAFENPNEHEPYKHGTKAHHA